MSFLRGKSSYVLNISRYFQVQATFDQRVKYAIGRSAAMRVRRGAAYERRFNWPRICSLASASVRCQISSAIGLATLLEDMADQTHGARHHTKATDTCHSSPSQQIAPMALIGKSRS